MIFTDHNLFMFKSRAGFLLSKLREWEKHNNDTKAQFIVNDFMEVCSMGYAIAMDEVHSTPWEFLFQSIGPSANENEAEMNKHASLGWEYLASDGRWVILRRRKAVSDGTK